MSSIQAAVDPAVTRLDGWTQGFHESRKPAALRQACEQFEGLLLGMILKESLRETFSESEADAAGAMAMLRDVCIEKMASSLAETSPVGLADQLLQELGTGGGNRDE